MNVVSVPVVVLIAWLALIAVVDQRTGRIPNALVVPAVAGTAAVAVVVPSVGVSALVLLIPYAVAFVTRTGGGGDLKLAVPCGGLLADPLLAASAAVLAAAVTLIVCSASGTSRTPHGPALVMSAVLLAIL